MPSFLQSTNGLQLDRGGADRPGTMLYPLNKSGLSSSSQPAQVVVQASQAQVRSSSLNTQPETWQWHDRSLVVHAELSHLAPFFFRQSIFDVRSAVSSSSSAQLGGGNPSGKEFFFFFFTTP